METKSDLDSRIVSSIAPAALCIPPNQNMITATLPSAPRGNACILYGRLSRGDESPDAQNRRMQKYRDLEELVVFGEFVDDDTTGDTDKIPIRDRTGGGQVMRLLATGRVGHLI